MDYEEALESNVVHAFGVASEWLEDDYVSAADAEYEAFTAMARSPQELKYAQAKLTKYKAQVEREVDEGVGMAMQRHISENQNLLTVAGQVRESLNGVYAGVKNRTVSAMEALGAIEQAKANLARLRRERDGLSISVAVEEMKSAHPHRTRDAQNRHLPSHVRPSIFEEEIPKGGHQTNPFGFSGTTGDELQKSDTDALGRPIIRRVHSR